MSKITICAASTIAGCSLEGPMNKLPYMCKDRLEQVATWCSVLLTAVEDETWKALDVAFAVDPASYVITQEIEYVPLNDHCP